MAQIEICGGCGGLGYIRCPICSGSGFMTKKVVPAGAMKLPEKVECHTCLGTGRLICKMCEGVGKILIEKHSSSEK